MQEISSESERLHRRNERQIKELSELVNRLSRVERPDIIWHQLKDFAAKLGMQNLMVLTANIGPKFAPSFLYVDTPKKLLAALDEEWPPPRNPALRHTRAVLKPFAMSEVENRFSVLGFDWRRYLPSSLRAGDALVVPITDGKLDAVALFAGAEPQMRPLARALLQVAAQYAFQRARKRVSAASYSSQPASIVSKRERDCFRQAAMGKGDADIARMLGISLRTVRFHFANAKAKLGAANRSEAIAMIAGAHA